MNNYQNYFNHGKKTTQATPEELTNELTERDPVTELEKLDEHINVLVTCTSLNVRKAASKESSVLSVVKKDDILEVEETIEKEWTKVKTQNGVEGYVMTEFIKEV